MAEKKIAKPITVLVAERRELTRTLIRMALEGFEDIELVAETDCGLGAVAEARLLRPDVVVVRGDVPRYDGFQTARRITEEEPNCAVLIIHDEQPRSTLQAIRSGAVGYITENNDLTDLHAAIRALGGGHSFISRELLRQVLHDLEEGSPPGSSRPVRDLSSRQKQILVLVAEGRSPTEIGETLHISAATVRSHMTRIRKRVGTRSPGDIMRIAQAVMGYDVTDPHTLRSASTVA
ncbi:MAG: response regulator [Actinomycetota bacterium]